VGETWVLSVTITSPISDPGTGGSSSLYVDGLAVSTYGPPWFGTHLALPVGSHTLYAKYSGSSTRPACTSNTITVTVRKASTSITIVPESVPELVRFGQPATIVANVVTIEGVPSAPIGNVRWYELGTLLGTSPTAEQCCPLKGSTTFQLPTLPVGLHYLDANFAGNAAYEASPLAGRVRVIVTPAEGFTIDASVNSNYRVRVVGNRPAAPGRSFTVYRRINSGDWRVVTEGSPDAAFQDSLGDYDSVYQYRMDMYQGGVLAASSNIDVVALGSYVTDHLRGAVNVRVYADHLQELTFPINRMRKAAGLAPFTLDGVAPGQYIRASHFVKLRDMLNEARAAFGANPIASDVAVSAIISARHLEAIREGIR
jgi:hypothetical protein